MLGLKASHASLELEGRWQRCQENASLEVGAFPQMELGQTNPPSPLLWDRGAPGTPEDNVNQCTG